MKIGDFSETIAACDLKVDRCRQLIELLKICEYLRFVKAKRCMKAFRQKEMKI